jgi:hypothetical protein
MTTVRPVTNKKHLVTQINVSFSGAVNAAEADSLNVYRLATAGKHGSYTAENAKVINLKSAVYNPASDSVTLTPKKAFALTKPVQLVVDGQPPSGLEDSAGRVINGGNNAVAVLTRGGATITAVRHRPTDARSHRPSPRLPILRPADVDALLERIDAIELTRNQSDRIEKRLVRNDGRQEKFDHGLHESHGSEG